MAAKVNRIPTVVGPNGRASTREKIAFKREQPPEHLDYETRKFLTNIQDNMANATEATRSDPTLNKKIIQQAINLDAIPTGAKFAKVTILHGLGQSFSGYRCTRAYPTTKDGKVESQPFAAVEAPNNDGQDKTQYLVLKVASVGCFDLEIFA